MPDDWSSDDVTQTFEGPGSAGRGRSRMSIPLVCAAFLTAALLVITAQLPQRWTLYGMELGFLGSFLSAGGRLLANPYWRQAGQSTRRRVVAVAPTAMPSLSPERSRAAWKMSAVLIIGLIAAAIFTRFTGNLPPLALAVEGWTLVCAVAVGFAVVGYRWLRCGLVRIGYVMRYGLWLFRVQCGEPEMTLYALGERVGESDLAAAVGGPLLVVGFVFGLATVAF